MRLAAGVIALRDNELESSDQAAEGEVVADILMARGSADRAGQGELVEQIKQFDHAGLQLELRFHSLGKAARRRAPEGVVIEPFAEALEEGRPRRRAGQAH